MGAARRVLLAQRRVNHRQNSIRLAKRMEGGRLFSSLFTPGIALTQPVEPFLVRRGDEPSARLPSRERAFMRVLGRRDAFSLQAEAA